LEEWLPQLLLQVPFAGIVIYFMLKHGDQDAKERQERDTQWREFLKQRDEQWIAALGRLNETYVSISGALVKQQEATNEQLKALAVEMKAAQIKYAQMEQFIVLSVDQLQARPPRARKSQVVKP